MARFIARVQLHEDGDYGALHAGMATLGFVPTMPDLGVPALRLQLPEGTYYRTSDHDDVMRALTLEVCEAAVKANQGRKAMVLVVKAAGGAEDVFEIGLPAVK
jgi:hypothetical protein